MCAVHEATTKTQPRNGIRTRCHDDDLRFETIITNKSTTPATQSRPTSVPSEARHAISAVQIQQLTPLEVNRQRSGGIELSGVGVTAGQPNQSRRNH